LREKQESAKPSHHAAILCPDVASRLSAKAL
jgi:hypothetical protein